MNYGFLSSGFGQVIMFVYVTTCVISVGFFVYEACITIPRLKKAVYLTANSLICAYKFKDVHCICIERAKDIGETVPKIAALLCGALAALALAALPTSVPIGVQIMIIIIMPAYGMYSLILELDFPNGDSEEKFSKKRSLIQ